MADSPFEIVTSSKSKKGSKGIIVAVIVVVFLILSVVAGVLLVRQRQNVQEKALVPQCPADEQCPVTKDNTHLRTCDFVQSDNSPNEELCNTQRAGIISSCGGVKFCCPSAGASWTTNTSLCPAPKIGSYCQANWQCPTGSICSIPAGDDAGTCVGPSASPSPSPTITPIPSPTVTPLSTSTPLASASVTPGSTATAGATATPTAASSSSSGVQTTPLPVPVTGVDWPSMAGIGVGAAAIILSILLAL